MALYMQEAGEYDSENYWLTVTLGVNREIKIIVPKDKGNFYFAEGEVNEVWLNLVYGGHYE